jgi:hypothetical protein
MSFDNAFTIQWGKDISTNGASKMTLPKINWHLYLTSHEKITQNRFKCPNIRCKKL